MTQPVPVSTLNVETLARLIDQAVLRPDHTVEDVEAACQDAVALGFHTVLVSPYDVELAAKLLRGTGVAAGGAVDVPLGQSGPRAKAAAAQHCIESGAEEVDAVLNLIAMKSGRYADVRAEIAILRKITEGCVLKVILECGRLTDEEKARAVELAVEAGADFVRTATGFGPAGATVHDVQLLVKAANGRAQVKAEGGIRTFAQVRDLLKAGAARIGTSTGPDLIRDFQGREDT
jgi:deoxyribose-phosphate aldolase